MKSNFCWPIVAHGTMVDAAAAASKWTGEPMVLPSIPATVGAIPAPVDLAQHVGEYAGVKSALTAAKTFEASIWQREFKCQVAYQSAADRIGHYALDSMHVARLCDPDQTGAVANYIAELAANKESALEFLKNIGVATSEGRLAKAFGG